MKRVRVVVVDDSALTRAMLRELLELDGDIEVVGEAADGGAAQEQVMRLMPQVVTMDIDMPGVGGMDAIEHIMASRPTPVLVVTSLVPQSRAEVAFEAVRRGALEVTGKPGGPSVDAQAARLRSRVRLLASVPVVRHVGLRKRHGDTVPPALSTPPSAQVTSRAAHPPRRVVAMAASAGGPAAVTDILSRLTPESGACVVLVQHLPIGFARAFSEFLASRTGFGALLVDQETLPRPGTVLLPTDDHHLVATPNRTFTASSAPPRRGHRPAAELLFSSIATAFGAEGVGVILSGIGDDGVEGLRAMRDAGGLTIAQHPSSAAVNGMPAAAVAAGAVSVVHKNAEIAKLLAEVVSGLRTGAAR